MTPPANRGEIPTLSLGRSLAVPAPGLLELLEIKAEYAAHLDPISLEALRTARQHAAGTGPVGLDDRFGWRI